MCNSHNQVARASKHTIRNHADLPAFSHHLELPEPVSLDEAIAMTPEQMAQSSRLVSGVYDELLRVAASLENPDYRELMTECVAAPKITFLELYPGEDDRKRMFDEMVKLGFFNAEDDPDHVWPSGNMKPQSYLTAPSSHNDFYNAHPGGLALTVAFNIRMADAYTENYKQMYGIPINRDLSAASLCVHEYPKVWLYQWLDNGAWLEEPRTVYDDTWHAHCIYVTAELMYRGYDPRIVMAMAAAHQLSMFDAWMEGRHAVVKWMGLERVSTFIRAAATMAQVDPVDYGLMEKKNGALVITPLAMEQWITHLADMNWPVSMGAGQNYTYDLLQGIAERDYGISDPDMTKLPFNQFKNYVWSQVGQLAMYEAWVREGDEAVRKLCHRLIQPKKG